MKNGTLAALGAFVLWGLLPVYWKSIEQVPPAEILSHRVVWSLLVVLLLLAAQKRWGWLRKAARKPAILVPFAGSALLLTANWFVYLWANNNGHIVEVSLGYFINPLISVLLGVLFLRERMRMWQWGAIGLAFAGVAYLTISYGRPPWIALSLALTFGFYGLIRKTAPLGSIEGLLIEMSLMFLPAIIFLGYLGAHGTGSFGREGPATTLMLAFAGLATAIPLILFAHGARSVPLSALGILQYIAPTLQFFVGVVVYREGFAQTQLIGFSIIWTALLLYWLEGLAMRRVRAQAPSPG
jgi:chloramphenicol-sensitive protein RarD